MYQLFYLNFLLLPPDIFAIQVLNLTTLLLDSPSFPGTEAEAAPSPGHSLMLFLSPSGGTYHGLKYMVMVDHLFSRAGAIAGHSHGYMPSA